MNKSLYPFEPKRFERNGLTMSYLDEGSGEPIVMVHGNPTWSFYFRNVVLTLRDNYRCIVPDHIGCGLSDKPNETTYDYSLKSRIDDLEALLDSLNLEDNVTLFMHDWGGMIGMGYAVRHPDKIRRLIVHNTAAFHLPGNKRFPRSLALGRNTRLGAWLILRLNLFCRLAMRWCMYRQRPNADIRSMYLLPYDSPLNRIAVLKFVQTIPLVRSDPGYDIVTSIENGLSQFSQLPVLFLWGMSDYVFDWKFHAVWRDKFPDALGYLWPFAGHFLLEQEWDKVKEALLGFLDRNPLTQS